MSNVKEGGGFRAVINYNNEYINYQSFTDNIMDELKLDVRPIITDNIMDELKLDVRLIITNIIELNKKDFETYIKDIT
jgi:hypothetical protein